MDLFGYPSPGVDDNKMNSHYQSLLKHNAQDIGGDGEDVKENPHNKPTNGQNPTGPMKGNLMTWTKMLEAMDDISDSIDEHNASVDELSAPPIDSDEPTSGSSEDEILNELDRVFTPILIMQGFEGDISDQIKEAYSEASVLTERTVISFDETARMAQLISVCALLLARNKQSEKYKMYAKAAAMKNKMKLEIQKDEYAEAKALAQKYLVKVSTTNNSSVARNAANDLLPQTQH
jgi:hypothetical protein